MANPASLLPAHCDLPIGQDAVKAFATARGWDRSDPLATALFFLAVWALAFGLEATVGAWARRRSKALLQSFQ